MICKAICRDCKNVIRTWNLFIYRDPDVWRCKAFVRFKGDCVGGYKSEYDWCWNHNREGDCDKFEIKGVINAKAEE